MCKTARNAKPAAILLLLLLGGGLFPRHAAARSTPSSLILLKHREAVLSGTYLGHAPSGDASKRAFTLNLAPDGTAALTTLFLGKQDATEHGRWKQTGNEVEITFNAIGDYQPPRPIIFLHRDHQLRPLHWDASEWGRSGPPVLYRAPRQTSANASL
jgi:hypothetical protein